MSQRIFAVYRENTEDTPRAIDISNMRSAAEITNRLNGKNWYGTFTDTPEKAIQEFRRHEIIRSLLSAELSLR